MQDNFCIKIADINIEITSQYPLTKQLCKDYIVPCENPDISVFATDEEVEADMRKSEESTTADYCEFICIYRKIAEQLPKFNAFVFHGASISYADKGYLFTAKSGTGKSTHIKLWRKHLGLAADIINGDKPIIKITNDGILVCSNPWAGKENWQKNRIFPLCGIAFLERSTTCFATPLSPKDALMKIMNQVYMPKNAEALSATLENIDKLLKEIPLYKFGCDISENAVKTSFEALTGEFYEEKKV